MVGMTYRTPIAIRPMESAAQPAEWPLGVIASHSPPNSLTLWLVTTSCPRARSGTAGARHRCLGVLGQHGRFRVVPHRSRWLHHRTRCPGRMSSPRSWPWVWQPRRTTSLQRWFACAAGVVVPLPARGERNRDQCKAEINQRRIHDAVAGGTRVSMLPQGMSPVRTSPIIQVRYRLRDLIRGDLWRPEPSGRPRNITELPSLPECRPHRPDRSGRPGLHLPGERSTPHRRRQPTHVDTSVVPRRADQRAVSDSSPGDGWP